MLISSNVNSYAGTYRHQCAGTDMINLSDKPAEESHMNIKRLGLDLAKQVFQILGVDGQDKVVLRRLNVGLLQ